MGFWEIGDILPSLLPHLTRVIGPATRRGGAQDSPIRTFIGLAGDRHALKKVKKAGVAANHSPRRTCRKTQRPQTALKVEHNTR